MKLTARSLRPASCGIDRCRRGRRRSAGGRARRARSRRRPRRPRAAPAATQRVARRASVSSASQSTSTPTSVATSRTRPPASSPAALACSGPGSSSAPATARARGPTATAAPRCDRALVQLDVVADLEAADHVEERLQRDALGVEQQLVAAVEDAQVAEHLALVGEEARRSSRWPGSSASMSFVTWPSRNALACASPVSASLPRSERSSSPQRGRGPRGSRRAVGGGGHVDRG